MGTLIKDGINYTGVNEVELTLAEYMLLSEDERNNGTYYITDANLEGGVTGTAGTIKPYVYSEEETVVGVYEGKPLYRKEIKKVLPTSTSQWETLTNIGVSNIDTPVKISGMLGSQPIPCGEGSYYVNLTFNNDGNIRINKKGWETTTPAILILEYTKTTDAAGSGNGLMPYGYVGGGGSSNPNYIFKDGEFNPIFDIKLVQENNCFNEIRGSKLFLSAINTQGGYARMYYTQVPIPRNKYKGVYLEFAQYNIIWSGYDTRIAFAKLSDITSPTGTPLSFTQSISGGINYYDLSSYNSGSEDMCLLFLCGLRDSYLTEITLTLKED